MDKYLKIFEPAMKKWLAEHYSPEEAKKRWERTVALDKKWIREEGDLGGRKNAMASNMLEAYAFSPSMIGWTEALLRRICKA